MPRITNPARKRFGGAAAIGAALGVYAVLSLTGGAVFAGDADLDTTFGTGGTVTTDIPGFAAFGDNTLVQADGKILVGGFRGGDIAVARYDTNGTLDMPFGGGDGIAVADFGAIAVHDEELGGGLALDGTTGIIAGSTYQTVLGNDEEDFALARFNANGTLDAGFGGGDGMVTTNIGPPDGANVNSEQLLGGVVVNGASIYAVGATGIASSPGESAIVKYDKLTGALDNTFDTNGIRVQDLFPSMLEYPTDVAFDPVSNKLVTTTAFDGSADNPGLGVNRFDPGNGNLDPTFSGDGIALADFGGPEGEQGFAVLPLSDGTVIAAGATSFSFSGGGQSSDFAIAKFLANGNPDTSFSADGQATTDFGPDISFFGDVVRDVTVQADNKIVAAGYSDVCDPFSADFAVARYTASGAPDTTFSGDGRLLTAIDNREDFGQGVAMSTHGTAPTQRIVVGGYSDLDFAVARYGTTAADSGAAYCPSMLTVSLAGSGSGTVTGDGINCPSDCSDGGDPGRSSNDLTATPATGSTFAGWEGNPDCDPATDVECFLSVGTNTTVTARFNSTGPPTTTTTTTTTTTPTTTTPATDTTPPETTITKGPKKKTPKPKAKLVFSSSESGSTFECALKGKKVKKKLKKFAPCSSPAKYKKLKPGKKQFQVRATDAAHNLDSTPAKKKWTVKP